MVKVKDQFERAQKQYESVNNDLKLAKGTIAELQIDKSELEEDIKERKIREKDFKHEEASIADLKKRIHLLEELNEIVLGEYSLEERPVDYGAMIIKGTAAVVITISMGLILLIVGNMVYQSISTKTEFRRRVILKF
ncbi:hypothetical protein FO519_006398 [Halicephalobus sp. NKZ332]|nr:hypothetical protein FO519_006398 [Halicephalobus sp. NKZ332]